MVEGQKKSLREVFAFTKNLLEKSNILSSEFEARVLIEEKLGVPKDCFFTDLDREVCVDKEFLEAVEKRILGYPLQYLIGCWEFYGNDFFVGEGVLIPRADTETLVDFVLEKYGAKRKKPLRILDICSGSGCIAITLAKEFENAEVTAIELSEVACRYIRKNAKANDVELKLINEDLLEVEFGDERFDIMVSNPPYIRTAELETLSKEVKFEPVMALDGKEDGLYFYKEIAKKYAKYLAVEGMIFFEVGYDQGESVGEILVENSFVEVENRNDLNGISRVVSGKIKTN